MIAPEALAGGQGLAAALPAASPAVAAAQQRLLELRRRHGVTSDEQRATSDELAAPSAIPAITKTSAAVAPGSRPPGPPAAARTDWAAVARLGLYSQPLAQHLKRATNDERRTPDDAAAVAPYPLPPAPVAPAPPLPRSPAQVKVYPDIAIAILREKQSAAGRVWLLLRGHDAAGRGAIGEDEAARLLTGAGSPLRICGRRQLANLLRAGDGLFWERRARMVWLRSVVRVGAALGVMRLGGLPVALPLSALLGKIGDVRAHLYASFHSGRQRADLLTGRPCPRGPIARATLSQLSAAAPNSQRAYERRAGVGRRSAIAVGPALGAADAQEVAWQRGRALFHLRDRDGRFGRPGAVYLAWHLPNEYTGPHATLPRGRQKRLNRALADLFHIGMTGNGERGGEAVASVQCSVGSIQCSVSSGSVGQWVSGQVAAVGGRSAAVSPSPLASRPSRRFYGSAKSACLARHDRERYWRGPGGTWYWQPEIRDTKDEIRVQKRTNPPPLIPDNGIL